MGTAGITSAALIPLPLASSLRRHPEDGPARRDAVTFALAVSLLCGVAAAAWPSRTT